MAGGLDEAGQVRVVFTGTRRELAGMLLRGYSLLIPTIGLYRFWLTTWKRRFYWAHTEIGGDALEYTGHAIQLLLGFLMALAIFVPLYGLFFYLSTQSSEAAMIGYGGVAIVLWFLAGYAIYRARDFRLSRTLWRGIRFDQAGSAWRYAVRRFFWSILVIATAGLAYPFMAASLWRYRYQNSWYGDRSFGFEGHWKRLVRPFYISYIAIVVVGAIGLGIAAAMGAFPESGDTDIAGYPPIIIAALMIAILVTNYRAREMTQMFSAVTLGQARLTVSLPTWSLGLRYINFALALLAAFIVLAVGGFMVLGTLAADAFADGGFDLAILLSHMQGSVAVLVAIVFGYLLILAAFTLMNELFLGLGFWKLLASNSAISELDSLRDVQARGEDTALAGEGLADALNVGAY